MHASWLSACQPVPISPSVLASGFARCRAATALAAPVRSCPSRSASISASSSGPSAAKSAKTKRVPSANPTYVFTPARWSSRSEAAMTCRRPDSSPSRRRGSFSTTPFAMRTKQPSTASTASAGLRISSTSASRR